ncbi:MAG: hypothetical protein ROW39_04515 [Anaerolineaceae bacterium]|jgi:hypothetical protein
MSDFILDSRFRDLIVNRDVRDILGHIHLPTLYIQGIEVTQAVQYYRSSQHLTDPADRAADNAVTLIAGKPAWVRVYVRAGFFHSNISGVTGTLEVSRRIHGFFYPPGSILSPQPPGTVTARSNPNYATERGTLSYTLNFIIPADMMCGRLRLTARIQSPSGDTDDHVIYINATLRQTLRLRGIMIGYNGPTSSAPGAPNLTLAAPTLADLQATAAWTLLTFPVRSFANFSSGGTITWTQPLTDAPSCPGCCSPNWVALNAAVQAQRVADGNLPNWLYYGLMANGIPMGPIVGCNTPGISTGGNGAGVTMAHELGHHCGLPHAPCGTPGDPNYPAYEPYDPAGTPTASIGEYGLDISNGNILPPNTKDLMSYCGPRWISLYNYGRLTNIAGLNPARVCVDHFWWRDFVLYDPILIPERWLPDPPPDEPWRQRVTPRTPLISVIGIMHAENEIEITSLMRVEASPEVSGGKETSYTVELLGEKEKVVARGRLVRLPHSGGCGCDCGCEEQGESYPFVFQAFVPDVERGAALRIRRGSEPVWQRQAPKIAPSITSFKARVRENLLVAQWNWEGGRDQEAEFWLQWSNDDGKTWYALMTGIRQERAEIGLQGLPAGRILVRVLGSDGFSTAMSKPVSVELPEGPLAVSIMMPRQDQTLQAGAPMRLWGVVSSGREDEPGEVRARWELDGVSVAEGLDVFIEAPREGDHKLVLAAYVGNQRGEAAISFRTVHVPSEDELNDEFGKQSSA